MRALPYVILALALHVAPAAAIVITDCNTTIPPREIGILAGDLTCSDTGWAVLLEEGATLLLDGFTLSGGGLAYGAYVTCNGSCTVQGPGRITGDPFTTGIASGRGRVQVENLELDHVREGILVPATGTKLTVRDVNSHHCLNACISAYRVKAERVSSSNNSYYGFAVGNLRGVDVTANDNQQGGIIASNKVAVDNLTATNNGNIGVYGRRVLLMNSTVTGNDVNNQIDIQSHNPPRLRNTVCGKSQVDDAPLGTTWGVCTND